MGFGPINPEPNEPLFHAEWEKTALGLQLSCNALGHTNIDANRIARESLPPAVYYASSYYELWIRGLEATLKLHGLVTDADLGAGHAVDIAAKPKYILRAADVPATLKRGGPCDRPIATAAKFAVGETVRTLNFHPVHHTRLPRYARGKTGVIEAVHGGYVFPDTNAHFLGENPQRLYTVTFSAQELWGPDGDATSTVSIDAWEGYLERG